MNFLQELEWRNLVKDTTDKEALEKRLLEPIVVYCGFDPTADSLHIGHLQQLLLLKRFLDVGHTVIPLLGGATGMIGDPRPTSERALTSLEEIAHNVLAIKKQFEHILGDHERVIILNNHDWLSQFKVLEFLRDYGKHFNVNTMISKDIVANRLETGISYTEFSYTLLQAADWLHLYENYNCELQIGGSDQWGNLTSGTELIRKMSTQPARVFAMTSPLIMKSDGSKFGKSEGKNIWLDPDKTNAYAFYQYWYNVGDDDVIEYLKRLSFKSKAEIETLIEHVQSEPHLRAAQKALAAELTALVFDSEALSMALRISDIYFSMEYEKLSLDEFEMAFEDAPFIEIVDQQPILEVLSQAGLISSNRQGRDLIKQGAISINQRKVDDFYAPVKRAESYHQQYAIIKKGRKHFVVARFIND
ncbi:MAG: tyrosine--tRNA ligase [Erysipelothrix sp.]|jgi:tyrosyl-tRNA synthetase|nr:tyrosine--tRNA ligase [Erysipelothrix sp.]